MRVKAERDRIREEERERELVKAAAASEAVGEDAEKDIVITRAYSHQKILDGLQSVFLKYYITCGQKRCESLSRVWVVPH